MNERRLPLGLALVIFGLVVLGAVALIYTVAPAAPPSLAALLPQLGRTRPGQEASAERVVLLPQSPALPSEARASEAPTAYPGSGASQPSRIVIPALEVDAPVWRVDLVPVEQEGSSFLQWQVPEAYAVGWHAGSASLGEPGNTVLNGHHNVHGSVFRNLRDLAPGATVLLYDGDQEYAYEVTRNELLLEKDQPLVVRRINASWMEPTADERITIVSCWPQYDNSHRVVVVARPVE